MATTRTVPEVDSGLDTTISDVLDDYQLSLHAAGKSASTRDVYIWSLRGALSKAWTSAEASLPLDWQLTGLSLPSV